jgi:hypothetical protein
MTFSSTVKFSTSMKCWWTMPMPGGDGGVRVLDHGFLAVNEDVAIVGLVEAVEDRHQCRFAGAVLADDAVDRALPDLHVDVLVGVNEAEFLVDPLQLNGNVVHVPSTFYVCHHQFRCWCRSGIEPHQKVGMRPGCSFPRVGCSGLSKSHSDFRVPALVSTVLNAKSRII